MNCDIEMKEGGTRIYSVERVAIDAKEEKENFDVEPNPGTLPA